MDIEQLLEQIQTNYDKFSEFQRLNSLEVEIAPDILPTSLEELGVSLEELMVAQEELIQQNQELEASREQIERERQRYRQLFDRAPEAYVVTDTVGIIKEINHPACQLLGVVSLYSLGKPIISFIPFDARFNFRHKLNQLSQTLSINDWEMELVPRNGEPVQVSVSVSYQFIEDNEEPSVLWLIRNISDRYRAEVATKRAIAAETSNQLLKHQMEARRCLEKALRESEARYRYIFESVGVAIWEADFSAVKQEITALKAVGVEDFSGYLREKPSFIERALDKIIVLNFNNTARLLCRAQNKIELLGSLRTIFSPETRNGFERILLAIASGETYISGETVLKTLDGNLINVLFTSHLPEEGKSPARVLITVIDISDRKRVEETLQQQAEELYVLNKSLLETTELVVNSNQDLNSFVHRVAHAIQAPLRGISHLVTWLEEDLDKYLNNETRHNMNLLCRRVERLEDMVQVLLQYSRVEAEEEEAVEINLKELVESAIESLSSSSGFLIENLLPPSYSLIGKRSLLLLVLVQLLSNAITHHQGSDGSIEVACREGENFYEFAVKDDGPGIAAEYHERIFEIFQVVPPSQPMDNLGIGLALMKRIINNEGGRIWLNSDLGKGATFYFTWPK